MIEVESLYPTGKQIIAYKAPEMFLLYGGAMGGGKSVWLVNYAIELSMRHPGNRGFLCRHELASFKRTTQMTLDEWLPLELLAQHNKSDNFYKFKNGSMIMYGGLGDDKRAIEKIKSMEIGWYGIDQAEETTEAFFFMLNSRLRLRAAGGEYKGLLTANPAPNWVKARFIDQQLLNHRFIPALPKDNPHNPPNYEEMMREMLPEDLVDVWVEGDWEAISETNNVYKYAQVMAAMQREVEVAEDDTEEYGVDVAEFGTDETVVAKKKGKRFEIVAIWKHKDPMEQVGEIIKLVDHNKKVFIKIDAIGPGNGVYYRLNEQGYNVFPIKGSASPSAQHKDKYKNAKTEHYWQLRQALPDIQLPDDPVLRSQMTSCQYRVLSSDGLFRIESKEELRKRGLHSPDRLEAIIYANARVGEAGDVWILQGEDDSTPWHKQIEEEYVFPDDIEQLSTPENAKKYIALLRKHDNNMAKVAEDMGISRDLLRRWVTLKRDWIQQVGQGGSGKAGDEVWVI